MAEAPRVTTVAGAATRSFDDFFIASAARVVGLVAVVTGDAAAAEDATQVAYLRAAQRWERVSRLDRPDLWVVRVATRLAVDAWRRRRREATTLESDTTAAVRDDIERLWVRWGLEQLSPRQRAAVVLHHARGLPVDEVAGSMATSPETVRTHLRRARARLRSLFREDR